MKLKRVVIISILIAISVSTISYYFLRTKYNIVHPHKGNIVEAVYGLGRVKSNKRFEIKLGVVSTVSDRFVYEGQVVDQGAPLIRFDDQVVFRAPFKGTVTYASLFKGETVAPHVAILRLEDLNDRFIELSLEQQSILRVKVGQPALISFESLRRKNLKGKVSAIFPREDEFLVRITVDGLDENILPGMTADVAIEIGDVKDALLVPLAAVKNGMISIKKDGHWEKVKVEIGHIDGSYAEILDQSLTPNDEIRVKTGG